MTIMPRQQLPYHIALLRGYNLNQRRNLAKSVIVEQEQLDRAQLPNSVKEFLEPENLSSRRGSTAP
ncbi:MAG TPA: hypothetical protein DEF45_23095 [Rhodopirellula sp.]|nr:hypothetical protein [Rhodopirellula sp.]